ncbi:MAG: 4Fe-4S double cluster binding domain-containing protein [Candidatus Contubernalis sp.]|nr:4Fe-4S double cluster binding domain-containing protein [Candidatus Contubernalis sp.]
MVSKLLANTTDLIDSEVFKLHVKKMGASVVDFGDVSTGLAKEFSHMPKAISLGIKHPPIEKNLNNVDFYPHLYVSIDMRLQRIQKKLSKALRQSGWKALPIPPDSHRIDNSFISRLFPLFPHKTAATCAGLGWVGKSGLLISRDYGSRMSWATILTDAPLEAYPRPITSSQCGECRRCVNACPAGAITGKHWKRLESYESMIDTEKCSAYLQKNNEKYGQFVCGICILACPQGINKESD